MSDKKTSGVKKDISLKEFEAGLAPETPKMKRERFFKRVKDVFSFFGIIDEGYSKADSGGSIINNTPTTNQSFRESHRVEPQQKSHEDYVREKIAQEAYLKMVDGKGDNDCNCK